MRRGDTVGQERLTDQSVALIIKSRARTAHLPAELLPKLAGHSLRAGYATAAAAAGIEERKIANVTRHERHHRPAPLHPLSDGVRRRRRGAVARRRDVLTERFRRSSRSSAPRRACPPPRWSSSTRCDPSWPRRPPRWTRAIRITPIWTSESKRARSNGLHLSPSATSGAQHPRLLPFAGVSWRRKRARAWATLQSSRAAPVRSRAGSCVLLTVPIPSGFGPSEDGDK